MKVRIKFDPVGQYWDIESRQFWPLPWRYVRAYKDKQEALEVAKNLVNPKIIYLRATYYNY